MAVKVEVNPVEVLEQLSGWDLESCLAAFLRKHGAAMLEDFGISFNAALRRTLPSRKSR